MTRYIVVTGTDTDVGKTVVTAALVVVLQGQGHRVAVVKPAQTGVDGAAPGDVATVRRLTGLADVHEHVRLRPALAPESAARIEGHGLPTVAEHASRIRRVDADVVVVEGAGGVLVRLDLEGGTVRDLARLLDADVVLVTREGLGTLNHTQLTLASLAEAGLATTLVIGSAAARPDAASVANREDLPRLTGLPVAASVPAGAGDLSRAAFRAAAPTWFGQPSDAPTASPTR